MTQPAAEQTRLEMILQAMKDQNIRFAQGVNRLETIGHKIMDTNSPQKAEGQDASTPNGLLETVEQEVRSTGAYNDRLDQLIHKLATLL